MGGEAGDSRFEGAGRGKLHTLGVVCGLTAGVWLGAAEAPTKLVSTGLSPILVSFAMVCGVFVGRWTLPTVLRGTRYVLLDLGERPHLILWAVMAGALWAVANTLTVFAIRDVGLSIAFPLWNTNSLVGLFWGWMLFNELRGAGGKVWVKVLGGAIAIAGGTALLAYASASPSAADSQRATAGIVAALGAGLLWGTMYIPYRKAYLSGMNPLSFVTVFTVGELVTMATLTLALGGGWTVWEEVWRARPALFWLFLGGFCWVIGDLFQQYAAKYIGIGRGMPLSNTNQLWGLGWGALVFGELAAHGSTTRWLVVSGSVVMILGALAISTAVAPAREQASWQKAMLRECQRYGLDPERVGAAQAGEDRLAAEGERRKWLDAPIGAVALAAFLGLASIAGRPPMTVNGYWMAALAAVMMASLGAAGTLLWKRTRFS